jgi:ribonucleoside-diphosphate reductase alpha chain
MRRGGGVGYDFSRIRPRGAWVAARSSNASGPGQLHARVRPQLRDGGVGRQRAAARRWACCAATTRTSRNSSTPRTRATCATSTSVGVTDAFMQAVQDDGEVELVHRPSPAPRRRPQAPTARRRPVGVPQVPPARCGTRSCAATYDHAEPGVLFLDRINIDNNLAYCETIAATNPCAEQPLPPYGCCCLGSIDLTRFVRDPFERRRRFDDAGLRRRCAAVRCACSTTCSTSRCGRCRSSRRPQQAPRRPGLHRPGRCAGDARPALRHRAGARHGRARISEVMRDAAYAASASWPRERGAFPLFNADLYLSAGQLRVAPAAA